MSRRFGCLGPALRPNIHQVSNEAATTAVPAASRRRRTRRGGSAGAAEVRIFFAAIQRILPRNKKAPEADASGAGRYLLIYLPALPALPALLQNCTFTPNRR